MEENNAVKPSPSLYRQVENRNSPSYFSRSLARSSPVLRVLFGAPIGSSTENAEVSLISSLCHVCRAQSCLLPAIWVPAGGPRAPRHAVVTGKAGVRAVAAPP